MLAALSDNKKLTNMQIQIERQIVLADENEMLGIPTTEEMMLWAQAAFDAADFHKDCAFTARFVSNDEIQELNKTYRHMDKPTNILSFPYEIPDDLPTEVLEAEEAEEGVYLGDLVIAMAVVRKEANEQDKTLTEHCVHLIVHGCLHLLGYDHITDEEAQEMEGLEIKVLEQLGYPNPYEE